MQISNRIYPLGVLLLILSGATLFFGADTPLTTYIFSGSLILLTGIWFLTAGRGVEIPTTALVPAFLLLLFFCMDIYVDRLAPALPDYAGLLAAGAVFLMARAWCRSTDRASQLWSFMIFIMAALAVWAFIDFLLAPEEIFGRIRPWHENRLSMTFLSANTAATFMGIGFLIALSTLTKTVVEIGFSQPLLLAEELVRKSAPALVLFLVSFICLILTASRAGLTFCMVSAALLILWEIDVARRKAGAKAGTGLGKTLLGLCVLGLGALVLWGVYAEVLGARTSGLGEDANERAVMYKAYASTLQDNFLIGQGFGSFDSINNQLMTAENAHILSTQGAAHNIFLQWLMQTGLFGTLAMVGVIVFILGSIAKGLTTRRRLRGKLRAILCISLFVILHGQVDYALEIPGLMWWWALLLGMGAGIADGRATPPLSNRRQAA